MATVATAPVAQGKQANGISAPSGSRREQFLKVYQVLRDGLIKDSLLGDQPGFAQQHLREALDYNVPGGKLNRGMAVADSLSAIRHPEAPTEDELFQADVLGWCIEWLQAFFLVADDIMDNSVTRRGQPCWYRLPKIGLVACNDYIILESCIYRILQQHFRSHQSYAHILDLFHEIGLQEHLILGLLALSTLTAILARLSTTHQTSHGQLLDIMTAPIGTVDLSRYTLPTYMRIVTYKTAFYSFYLPVACGLLVAGITDEQALGSARDICLQMGQCFQIQDDYLDCYGDPSIIGKIGTDIQDNKCSWLVVQALERASAAQQNVIKDNYGRDDSAAVEAVKAVYRELKLHDVFLKYEQDSYETIMAAIQKQTQLPHAVFTAFLQKIYKRMK